MRFGLWKEMKSSDDLTEMPTLPLFLLEWTQNRPFRGKHRFSRRKVPPSLRRSARHWVIVIATDKAHRHHGENHFVALTKRFVTLANQNCCGGHFNCDNNNMNCHHNNYSCRRNKWNSYHCISGDLRLYKETFCGGSKVIFTVTAFQYHCICPGINYTFILGKDAQDKMRAFVTMFFAEFSWQSTFLLYMFTFRQVLNYFQGLGCTVRSKTCTFNTITRVEELTDLNFFEIGNNLPSTTYNLNEPNLT